MERRTMNAFASDFTTREENGSPVIAGYFSVFGQDYEILPAYTESIDRYAFETELGKDVRALINHDTSLVLGRTSAGTLKLRTDDHGLYGEIQVNPKDTEAMNCYERVKRGDVSQCSFGFQITDEEADYRSDGSTHWTIKGLNLFEVSVCTFPAYEGTAVSARSADIEKDKKRRNDIWKDKMMKRLKGER